MIAIVDYGIGNIGSIANMLKKIGEKDVVFAHNPKDLENAEKIILPGVGSFDTGITQLNKSGLRSVLDYCVLEKKIPILGICLGMQLLGTKSEEGLEKGLGYIPFVCKKFSFESQQLKVPHMGWDYINVAKDNKLITDLKTKQRFYFVHSYYVSCQDENDISMLCDYGGNFCAAVEHENVLGVQFHPEKSHQFGMRLFENFIKNL